MATKVGSVMKASNVMIKCIKTLNIIGIGDQKLKIKRVGIPL